MFASTFRKPAQLVLRHPLICQTTSSLLTVLMDTPTPGEGLWRRLWLSWLVCAWTLWPHVQPIHDYTVPVVIVWRCSKLFIPDCLFDYYFDIFRKEGRYCKGQRRLHAHVLQKLLRWQWHCWSSGTSPKLFCRCCLYFLSLQKKKAESQINHRHPKYFICFKGSVILDSLSVFLCWDVALWNVLKHQ